ncbi:MAG: hypothetical protein KUG82_16495 [Pseudomonadales bacterium]|nr:hypothetical protein [Pseudomonadales bacterium]
MKRYLVRYQHTLFIVIACVLPFGMESELLIAIVSAIAHPIKKVAQATGNILDQWVLLVGVQLIFSVWMLIQKKMILGAPFTTFCHTLPISLRSHWVTTFKVNIHANNIMWLFFIFPLIQIGHESYQIFIGTFDINHVEHLVLTLVRFVLMVLHVLLLQMALIYQRLFGVISIIGIDTALVMLSGLESKLLSYTGLAVVSVACYLLWLYLSTKPVVPYFKSHRDVKQTHSPKQISMFLSPILTISLKILFQERAAATASRIGFGVMISVFISYIVSESTITGKPLDLNYVSIVLIFLTYVTSGLFCQLSEERKMIEPFLKSLPQRRYTWLLIDSAFIFIALLISFLFFGVFLVSTGKTTIIALIPILIYVLPLIMVLYPIRNSMEKQGSVAALATCVVWAVIPIVYQNI